MFHGVCLGRLAAVGVLKNTSRNAFNPFKKLTLVLAHKLNPSLSARMSLVHIHIATGGYT